MYVVILGDGALGGAVASGLLARGDTADLIGRATARRDIDIAVSRADVAVEASRGDDVLANLRTIVAAGCRRVVIATTGWDGDRRAAEELMRHNDVAAVAAPNFSLGMFEFGRLVDAAVSLFGPLAAFDPYVLELHRQTKADRPSGTAVALADRIVAAHPRKQRRNDPRTGGRPDPAGLEVASIRAGASPGMHVVGFDAPGESVELRITARDRSAYADGILAAADWLCRANRSPGIHPFDPVVDELISRTVPA